MCEVTSSIHLFSRNHAPNIVPSDAIKDQACRSGPLRFAADPPMASLCGLRWQHSQLGVFKMG